MLSILRGGPKLAVFGSTEVEKLTEFLRTNLSGTITDLSSALEIADENNTIVFITLPDKKVAGLEDVKSVILVPFSSDYLFSSLINLNGTIYVSDSHVPQGILVMRTMGEFDKILENVANTYNGKVMSLFDCLDTGHSNQTIVSFTDKPLNEKISMSDLRDQHVLIDIETNKLYAKIRNQALRFLNEGLVGIDWNDLQIRIYDRYSAYKLHYKRLSLVLDNLDMGLILGESWAKDYPRFLMSVLVYQVRLFTLLSPVEIKRVLLGLEYLEDGTRVVDLDLMHKNNKIDWPQVINKSTGRLDRKELGMILRSELLSKLSEEDKQRMYSLEEQILKTRD